MNNSDRAANPVPQQDMQSLGLTKREHFAALAQVPTATIVKALLAQDSKGFNLDKYIEAAVMYKVSEADALLKELDK